MSAQCTRRQLLLGGAAAAATGFTGRVFGFADSAPSARVAIAKCPAYDSGMLPALTRLFDQIGGLSGLVKGKTVAIKINMVGDIYYRVGHNPPEDTTGLTRT